MSRINPIAKSWQRRLVRGVASPQPGAMGVGFPVNAAEFAGAGLPLGSALGVRECGELSGDLADSSGGGITLTASGTVLYGQTATGTARKGVGFDGANESFAAASTGTYDLDASTSATILAAFACPTAPATLRAILHKRVTSGYNSSIFSSGGRPYLVVDDGPDTKTALTTSDHCDGALHGAAFVIDRGTDEIRVHTDLDNVTTDMAGAIGTLTSAVAYALGDGVAAASGDNVKIFYEAIVIGAAYTATDFANWWATRN